MYKISVIIPVYNAENTIERSINSFLNQKWNGDFSEDIQLILVDDCSTDDSKSIINKYADKYPNIYYFSTETNSGNPSKPRNIGIDKSRADFLMFMDNDDEYMPDICQTFYDNALKSDAEIVTCNYYNIDNVRTNPMTYNVKGENLLFEDDKIIIDSRDAPFFGNILVWNKIFKKSIINDNNIRFPERKSVEDYLFCKEIFLKVNKIVYLKDYFGIKRHFIDDSLSRDYNIDFVKMYIESFKRIHDLFKREIEYFDEYSFKFNDDIRNIKNLIQICSYIEDKKEMKDSMIELNEFEKYVEFEGSLGNRIYDFFNYFVVKEKYSVLILIFKLINKSRKSKLIKFIMNKILYK